MILHSCEEKLSFGLHTEAVVCSILRNYVFFKIHKFHWKAPVLESLFNKVADLLTLLKGHFYRTPLMAAFEE